MRTNEKTGWRLKPERKIRRTGGFCNLAILTHFAFFASSEALLIKDESKEEKLMCKVFEGLEAPSAGAEGFDFIAAKSRLAI